MFGKRTGSEETLRTLKAAAVLLFALACFGPAAADSSRIGYFRSLDGGTGFVLDRSGETPKQRYDGSSEIILLDTAPAARGDTIYKQADGLIVLRETPYGAMTLYSKRYSKGVAVVRLSDAVPLTSAPRSADEVAASARALGERLTASFGAPVPVKLPAAPLNPIGLGIVDEAIVNTGLAFDRRLTSPERTAALAEIVKAIEYRLARKPNGGIAKGVLSIEIAPSLGLEGRLSSVEIEALLSNGIASALPQGGAGFAASPQR